MCRPRAAMKTWMSMMEVKTMNPTPVRVAAVR
jgi:hypothetical protein